MKRGKECADKCVCGEITARRKARGGSERDGGERGKMEMQGVQREKDMKRGGRRDANICMVDT